MFEEAIGNQFKRDVKVVKKQGKERDKLDTIVEKLKNGEKLAPKHKDHALKGEYLGCRECHIAPDWLLVYRIDKVEKKLYLIRTGSHAELFESIIAELNAQLSQYVD